MSLCLLDISALLRQNMTISGIAKQLQTNRSAVYDILHQNGITDVRSYRISQKFNQNFFDRIDTEEKAYWLGFLFADGNVFIKNKTYRVSINIQKQDVGLLSKWHKSIGSCQNITFCGNMVRSIHHSQKMCEDLMKLGCGPRKSLVLKFPNLDSSLVKHFVRGYFDGDGCISWHHNKNQNKGGIRISFIGTDMFLNHLQSDVFFALGSKHKKIQPVGNSRGAFSLTIGGYQESREITSWMYSGANVFLDRKYQKYLDLDKRMCA